MKNSKDVTDSAALDELYRSSESLTISQEQFGNSVDDEIARLNAQTKSDNSRLDGKNRSKIALTLTRAFVVIVGVIVILGPVFNATLGRDAQVDIRGLLESFNSVYGAVLGFAIAYYFKDKTSEKHE